MYPSPKVIRPGSTTVQIEARRANRNCTRWPQVISPRTKPPPLVRQVTQALSPAPVKLSTTTARSGLMLIGARTGPPDAARNALSSTRIKVPEPLPTSTRTHTAFVESTPSMERRSGITRFAMSSAMLAESMAESPTWPLADVDAKQPTSSRIETRVTIRIVCGLANAFS
jgi:hypothetical protein